MSYRAVHIIVHGRVQGVGFRFFVREHAAKIGLKGWVKNLSDGAVEIHAEGEQDRLNEFISIVEQGPMFGTVTDLDTEWIHPANTYSGFSITF